MNSAILETKIRLENERVLLLPFEDTRHEELKDIIFDDEIWEFMGLFIRTETDFEAYLKNTLTEKQNGNCYPFLIIDKTSGKVAGSSRYGYLNLPSEKCEIGWTWYGTAFQGSGLNKACKYELLNFGFEQVGFRRIQFSADEENIRSQKAIEKLGAQKEGLFRNNYVDAKGLSRNDIYYSIIKEDWTEIKEEYFREFMHR